MGISIFDPKLNNQHEFPDDATELEIRDALAATAQYAGVEQAKARQLGVLGGFAANLLPKPQGPEYPTISTAAAAAMTPDAMRQTVSLMQGKIQQDQQLAQRDNEQREMIAQRERESVAQMTQAEKDRQAQLQYQTLQLNNQEKARKIQEKQLSLAEQEQANRNADQARKAAAAGRPQYERDSTLGGVWREDPNGGPPVFVPDQAAQTARQSLYGLRGGGGSGGGGTPGAGAITMDGVTYYQRWNATTGEYDFISQDGKVVTQTQLRERQQGGGLDPNTPAGQLAATRAAAEAWDAEFFKKKYELQRAAGGIPPSDEDVMASMRGPRPDVNALEQEVATSIEGGFRENAVRTPYLGKRMFVGKFNSMSEPEKMKFAQGGGTVTDNPDLVNIGSLSKSLAPPPQPAAPSQGDMITDENGKSWRIIVVDGQKRKVPA